MRTRRDRDVRLGYAGLVVGAGAFVGALVVTTTLVDVLPDLDLERPVLAQEQRVVDGMRMRPRAVAPGATGSIGLTSPAPVVVPAADTDPAPGSPGPASGSPYPAPGSPGPGSGPAAPEPTPEPTPDPNPGPSPAPSPGGDGPVSSLLNPVASAATQVLDDLTGGATQPVGQGAVAVVGLVGELADGPLEGQGRQGCPLTCP